MGGHPILRLYMIPVVWYRHHIGYLYNVKGSKCQRWAHSLPGPCLGTAGDFTQEGEHELLTTVISRGRSASFSELCDFVAESRQVNPVT